MPEIILASTSITRKALLEQLQIAFTVVAPYVDESPLANEQPADLALRLAKNKAMAVAKDYPNALIIGSDQVIMCNNTRLDKPGNAENAIEQLTLVSGNTIQSYTGLCLYNAATQKLQAAVENYQVSFRKLSRAVIEDYIKRDQPFHCAGSIKAEGIGMALFTRMEGRDYTALLGLPLILLTDMLLNENIQLLG